MSGRMRIVAGINPHDLINPTGVGKHIQHMLLGMASSPGIDLSLLGPPDQLRALAALPHDCPVRALPVRSYSLPRKLASLLWKTVGYPKADRWCSDADWLYCPGETYIPVKRVPFASTIHSLHWFDRSVPWYESRATAAARARMERVFRPVCRQARIVLTVSEYLKKQIAELFGIAPVRIAVVGNGVEECYFQAGAAPSEFNPDQEGGQYLLAVGSMHSTRGTEHLLALAEELHRRGSKLKILAAGGKLGDPRLVAQAQGLSNIELTDYTPAATLAAWMKRSVAVLLLSRYESFGMPAAEAMAAGAPVIAANTTALPEIVGTAGILMDATKPMEIADQVTELAGNGAWRDEWITRGRERAREFTWERCVERLLTALRGAS